MSNDLARFAAQMLTDRACAFDGASSVLCLSNFIAPGCGHSLLLLCVLGSSHYYRGPAAAQHVSPAVSRFSADLQHALRLDHWLHHPAAR